MAEIIEKITQGLSVETSNEGTTEPVSISDIKAFISMNAAITQHDSTLQTLIKACRIAVEDKLGVSLITRDVVSYWKKLYDFENLPYLPVTTNIEDITVTDFDDVAYSADVYKITGVGGFLQIHGDFEDGVKVSYTSGYSTVKPLHKLAIMNMVKAIFIDNISISEALKMYCKSLSR